MFHPVGSQPPSVYWRRRLLVLGSLALVLVLITLTVKAVGSGGNTAATLRAAAEEMSGVNAAMAYGTDGALAALGLVALRDDRGAQIVYAPAPVVRETVLQEHPEMRAVLDPVFATLTLETLQKLNAEIAVDGQDAGAVAGSYLQSKAFLP